MRTSSLLRLFASRPALLVISLGCIAVSMLIAADQFLVIRAHLAAMEHPENIGLEEDIAVILVALGVLMEERELLTKYLYDGEIPATEDRLNEAATLHGAAILAIGLCIEVLVQLHNYLLVLGPTAHAAAISVVFLLHVAGALVMVNFLRYLKPVPADAAAPPSGAA